MTSRTLVPLATLALFFGLNSGCTSGNCIDDGPVWQQNKCTAGGNSNTASDSDSESDSNSASESDSDSASAPTESASNTNTNTNTNTDSDSDSLTNSQSDPTATDTDSDSLTATVTDTNPSTDSDSDSDTGGGDQACNDADMDGYGDPTMCSPLGPGEDPPPGTVDNDGDCDDGDPNTFPGAAQDEDPVACMTDADDDGWGDSTPSNPEAEPGTDCDDDDVNTFPGAAPLDSADACMTDADGDDYGDDTPSNPDAMPGTDCDDSDAGTFPGSAESEVDPTVCMKDADGDGWGDAQPGDGVVGGLDCYDNNENFNPVDRIMFTVPDVGLPLGRVSEVDLTNGDITPFANLVIPLGGWNVYSAAISPIDGKVYGANSAGDKLRLVTFDYCDLVEPVVELDAHDKSICGLAFDAAGTLFGVNSEDDTLVTFDTTTGQILTSLDIEIGNNGVNVASCGMAYDCVHDRLLVVDGANSRVLAVNPADGKATVVSDPMLGQWTSVGAEYDVVTDRMWVINGTNQARDLFDVSLMDNTANQLDDLSESANDLTYGPVCP